MLLSDRQTLFHEPSDERDLFLVLQSTRNFPYSIDGGLECKSQCIAKHIREADAAGTHVDAHMVPTRVHAIDGPWPRTRDILEPEGNGLIEVDELTRDVERIFADELIEVPVHHGEIG